MLETVAFVGILVLMIGFLISLKGKPALYVDPALRRAARRGRRESRLDRDAVILVLSTHSDLMERLTLGLAPYAARVVQGADVSNVPAFAEMSPDAIIVHIEGFPTRNGFLVQKDIMRDQTLVDAVHVIVSSDPNARAIFEQHTKLKTRADAYFELREGADPIVASLVEQVPLERSAKVTAA